MAIPTVLASTAKPITLRRCDHSHTQNSYTGTFQQAAFLIANEKNEGRNRWKWRFDTPERYQEYMKNYYRLVSEVDATCGRVIDELKQQGVLDSTLVIFTTDNGYFHAEHGLADKWYPYEESIRVPLIIRDPRLSNDQRGSTRDQMTLNVDLAPTILSCARLAPPVTMQGTDLSPLYLSPSPATWRSDFYYEHATIRNTDFIPASAALVSKEWNISTGQISITSSCLISSKIAWKRTISRAMQITQANWLHFASASRNEICRELAP